jgi:glycosyltransferase involved in cell wall biosynthesis
VSDLVSVVVPAFNAEATIDETLRSVRAQTHLNLEILVIDDGSIDRTAEIAAAHALIDNRVRLIRQLNAGVASARNRGVSEAGADLLAFVDADDLWGPDKIHKQLLAFRSGGPRTGLVYTWYAFIDNENRIGATYRPIDVGDVRDRICRTNFVGNGSTALVTRTAFDRAGGFDPTLRAQGAQGCEDWQFYVDVAEGHDFAVVPEVLTGYRQSPNNMSSDPMRMLRSSGLVAERIRRRRPHLRAAVSRGNTEYAVWLLDRSIQQRHFLEAARLAGALFRRKPARAIRWFAERVTGSARHRLTAIKSAVPKTGHAPTFVIGDPITPS